MSLSRPLQIALGAALVFAVLWFLVLAPKSEDDFDSAAIPATPAATTPAPVEAGGKKAESAIGKTIETAKDGAANADSAVKSREGLTGDETTTSSSPAPSASTPSSSSSAAAPDDAVAAARAKADNEAEAQQVSNKSNTAQEKADNAIRSIQRDLKANRAVVFLVWSKAGSEDKIVHRRVSKEINKRGGRVKVYYADVKDVGRYDGLIGSLGVAQTPSVIVIAPSDQAQVLGGLVSTVRIDRLTSSALLTKAETK